MAETIHVNGISNSLAHKGCMGFVKNTVPDVCKTPSPGGPVPIPYPVIVSFAKDLSKGTKTVKVDGGNSAAIKGSEYSRCIGDEPGTAGGIKSNTNMKEATWLLYSFDVKMENKNACRLSDKMMMNHKNTVSLGGAVHPPVPLPMHECGQVGSYSKLKREGKAKPDFERDHVPSKAALFAKAKKMRPKMDPDQAKRVKKCVEARGIAIVIPKSSHRNFSPTCGPKNNATQISSDADNLNKARDRDLEAMEEHLEKKACQSDYKKAAAKVKKFDHLAMIKKCRKDCKKERWW